jgi:hypothetical protein
VRVRPLGRDRAGVSMLDDRLDARWQELVRLVAESEKL